MQIKTPGRNPKKFRSSTEGINGATTCRRFRKLVDHINNKAEEFGRKIKNELREEIVQRKISERSIEGCLPSKYKRNYMRSEVNYTNLLAIANTLQEKILKEKQPDSGHPGAKAISKNSPKPIKDDFQENVRKWAKITEKLLAKRAP